jgi:hypothetical protein
MSGLFQDAKNALSGAAGQAQDGDKLGLAQNQAGQTWDSAQQGAGDAANQAGNTAGSTWDSAQQGDGNAANQAGNAAGSTWDSAQQGAQGAVTPHKTNGILPTRELLMLPLTARTRATKPRTVLEAH